MKDQLKKLKKVIFAQTVQTDVFDPILSEMYTPEETLVIEAAGREIFYAKQAAEWLSVPIGEAKELLERGYRRGVFNKIAEAGEMAYASTDLFHYLDCFVLSDEERWNSYPRSLLTAADAWYFGEYGKRVDECMKSEETWPEEIVLPIEEALQYIDALPDELYVLPCDCNRICAVQDHKKAVCIQCSQATVNSMFDRGFGRRITKEEAKKIVRQCDQDGLIHSPTGYHFCNCGPKYCYPFRYSRLINTRREWPKSFYLAEIDMEKCIGCRQCEKRCPVSAITITEKKAVVDEKECAGCGVCRVPCPKEAITMKQTAPWPGAAL